MADYRPSWDDNTYMYARNWLKKHPGELTVDELHLLRAFMAAEERLRRVDKFLAALR